jgi:hypothetical protein
MANKLILVPSDMYHGLLQQQQRKNEMPVVDEGGDKTTNLGFTKANVEKVKKQKRKNLSTKNILYNQELRRFLRMRKNELERPVKVALTNGANALVKPSTSEVGILTEDGVEKADQETPKNAVSINDGHNEGESIPLPRYKFPDTTTPFRTASERRATLKKINETKNVNQKKKIDEFVNHIFTHSDVFNLTDKGQIMNERGDVIKGSNAVESVRRLLGAAHVTPPGTAALRKKAMQDPKLKALIAEGSSLWRNEPAQSTSKQSGSGEKRLFRPKLWMTK